MDPKVREKDTLSADFWKPIMEDTDFKQYLTNKYSIVNQSVMIADELE